MNEDIENRPRHIPPRGKFEETTSFFNLSKEGTPASSGSSLSRHCGAMGLTGGAGRPHRRPACPGRRSCRPASPMRLPLFFYSVQTSISRSLFPRGNHSTSGLHGDAVSAAFYADRLAAAGPSPEVPAVVPTNAIMRPVPTGKNYSVAATGCPTSTPRRRHAGPNFGRNGGAAL